MPQHYGQKQAPEKRNFHRNATGARLRAGQEEGGAGEAKVRGRLARTLAPPTLGNICMTQCGAGVTAMELRILHPVPIQSWAGRLVPKGRMRIAQRFSVGSLPAAIASPEGTAESMSHQPSLRDAALLCAGPNVETLGYSQASLRDEVREVIVSRSPERWTLNVRRSSFPSPTKEYRWLRLRPRTKTPAES